MDNITPSNRDHIDRRLNELEKQRKQLKIKLEELDRLSVSQDEIKILITEAIEFIASLEFTLTQGLPQEKLVALRQCIERIHINRSRNNIKIKVHKVPVGNLQTINELETCL